MSLSEIIAGRITNAVELLQTPGMSYRQGPGEAWADLACVFHAGPTEVIGFNEAGHAIVASASARIKIAAGGTVLKVNKAEEAWQVKQSDGTIWTVLGTSRHNGQTFYTLTRARTVAYGNVPGDTP